MIIVTKNGVSKQIETTGINVPVAVAAPIAFAAQGMWSQALVSLVTLPPLMWLTSAFIAGLVEGLGITYGTEANSIGLAASLVFPIMLGFKADRLIARHYVADGWAIQSGECPTKWDIAS